MREQVIMHDDASVSHSIKDTPPQATSLTVQSFGTEISLNPDDKAIVLTLCQGPCLRSHRGRGPAQWALGACPSPEGPDQP